MITDHMHFKMRIKYYSNTKFFNTLTHSKFITYEPIKRMHSNETVNFVLFPLQWRNSSLLHFMWIIFLIIYYNFHILFMNVSNHLIWLVSQIVKYMFLVMNEIFIFFDFYILSLKWSFQQCQLSRFSCF